MMNMIMKNRLLKENGQVVIDNEDPDGDRYISPKLAVPLQKIFENLCESVRDESRLIIYQRCTCTGLNGMKRAYRNISSLFFERFRILFFFENKR